MNVKRFTARTSRDALNLVRQALGDDAVVLSTRPSEGGVEVLAMAPDGMRQIEQMAAAQPAVAQPLAATRAAATPARRAAADATDATDATEAAPASAAAVASDDVGRDVSRLSMSTLSFQDYVRERMLRRRQAALASRRPPAHAGDSDDADDNRGFAPTLPPVFHDEPMRPAVQAAAPASAARPAPERGSVLEQRMSAVAAIRPESRRAAPAGADDPVLADAPMPALHAPLHVPPPLRRPMPRETQAARAAEPVRAAAATPTREDGDGDMLSELRAMKGLIEERFGALAFMEKLNRQPGQARLMQKLLDCGFSPALIKKIADGLTIDSVDETLWAAGVLERNLQTTEAEAPLEDQGGVYALVGPTGVGKTTTTAKIAAAFATKYGAANLGLITLDAYRIGAHEQLRAYGRILGVPVHTAHDRASLDDLLELLAGKKMVLIDTAGMAQRDARTRELLDMLSHRVIRKLLVVNAASQGETIEDVLIAYDAPACAGIVLSKLDEAVKLAPALDALIRMRLKVIGVANGQRVPEDWHRLSANALIHRALKGGGGAAYKLDPADLSLMFTAPLGGGAMPSARAATRPASYA